MLHNIGVGVVVRDKNKVLLTKRKNDLGFGTWTTPGGHLEYGESPEECAFRECKEEMGLEIFSPIFKGITNDIFQESKKHYISIWVEAKCSNFEICINDREVEDYGWFDDNNLPYPLFLPFEQLVLGNAYVPPTT